MTNNSNKVLDNINMENAHIMFRNFSGKETKFNRAGNMNFCVKIDQDLAVRLKEDGWNVRTLSAREEGDSDTFYLQVSVRYDNIPPKVYMVTKRKKELLDEESISCLDYAELKTIDLVIHPSTWELPSGAHGIKAYLKTGYFTIEEDAFADKYADVANPEEVPF